MVTRGGGNWRKIVKWYRLSVIREISSRHAIYSMMTITNTTIWFKEKLLRENSEFSSKGEKHFLSFYCTYMRRWMLVEPIVVIISQYIWILCCIPYTVMYANYFSMKHETNCEIYQVCRKECLKQIYNLIVIINIHVTYKTFPMCPLFARTSYHSW